MAKSFVFFKITEVLLIYYAPINDGFFFKVFHTFNEGNVLRTTGLQPTPVTGGGMEDSPSKMAERSAFDKAKRSRSDSELTSSAKKQKNDSSPNKVIPQSVSSWTRSTTEKLNIFYK